MLDLKKDFPIFRENPGLCFLDSGASAQKPSYVINFVADFYRKTYANIHRGVYKQSWETTVLYDKAREKTAEFLGVSTPETVIFTKNTTESINLVAYSFGESLKEGDEIIVSIMEHHANFVPWQILAQRKNLKLKIAYIDKNTLTLPVENITKLITDRTKLIALSMCSNVLGTISPFVEVCKIAKERGIKVLLDGAQYMPHHRINFNELGIEPDFVVFSGHKLCAFDGVGVLYGKKEVLEEMEPFLTGGDMIESVSIGKTEFAPLPNKFEAGTPPIGAVISLLKAIEYLEGIGLDKIEEHETMLAKEAIKRLKEIEGVHVFAPDRISNGIVSFTIDGIHPHDIATILAEDNVCIRAGMHCAEPLITHLGQDSFARATFYLYNDFGDVERLVKAVKRCKEVFKL